MHRTLRLGVLVTAALVFVAGCTTDSNQDSGTAGGDGDSIDGTTVTLLTHDFFFLSEDVLATFTAATGVKVEQLALGDAGQMVSEAVLTAGSPLGDVMFGIDNTFLQRGLDADIFVAYESANLAGVPDEFELDPLYRVTPVDFGDVCINYWKDAVPRTPSGLADLTDPVFADQLVVQSPETSSPGLAFLLATIAAYGDGWEQYWTDLRENGVSVTATWGAAYEGEFIAGGGPRSMVVSYASSPPAAVIFADPPVDTAPTGVLNDTCYRQIEFAGILKGTENVAGAQALIDFMLTPTWQNDVPLSMFVYPVLEGAVLPAEFIEHSSVAEDPYMLDPAVVEANRNDWTDRWVEIVLR